MTNMHIDLRRKSNTREDHEPGTQTAHPLSPDGRETVARLLDLQRRAPGIEHGFAEDGGVRTAVMAHADGSWARAEQVGNESPVVHQAGVRRLWDLLDEVRDYWLRHGALPLYGANVRIGPDGAIHLRRGRWKATVA